MNCEKRSQIGSCQLLVASCEWSTRTRSPSGAMHGLHLYPSPFIRGFKAKIRSRRHCATGTLRIELNEYGRRGAGDTLDLVAGMLKIYDPPYKEVNVSRPADLGCAFVTVYEQLRSVARARLAGTEGVSLQATMLVHEALLRLSGRALDSFADEQHVLAAASQAIRHVIVDHIRAKRAVKRNQGKTRLIGDDLPGIEAMLAGCDNQRADLALDLEQALEELALLDPEMKVIVELHVFGGIPLVEIGALVGQSERTVRRRWQFAAALLRQKLDSWNNSSRESAGDGTDASISEHA